MMMEAAFVFDKDGKVIHWHLPAGRSSGALPDSRDLWSVMWANRSNLGGVAHTHPWSGRSGPSGTDVTTFAACEKALGRRLLWPVITFTDVAVLAWDGPGDHEYAEVPKGFGDALLDPNDVEELRRLSGKPSVCAACGSASVDRDGDCLSCGHPFDEDPPQNEFEPDWASPPGDTIGDVMEVRDISPAELGERLGFESDVEMDKLMSGVLAITDEMASVLADVLGGNQQFWINREAQYRETLLRLANKEKNDGE